MVPRELTKGEILWRLLAWLCQEYLDECVRMRAAAVEEAERIIAEAK